MFHEPTRPVPVQPARLALSLSDAGSSGLIDIHDLRAEPLPLSLSSSLPPSRPSPHPSPPARAGWTRALLGSALVLGLALGALAVRLSPSTTVATEDRARVSGQLAMLEASAADRGELATERGAPSDRQAAREGIAPPARAGSAPNEAALDDRADEVDPAPSEPLATPEAELRPEAEPAQARERPAARSKASKASSASKPAKQSTPTRASKPATPKVDGSIPVACVLDPARCTASGSAAKAPVSAASTRPAPLPAKLSVAQLKAALATTKADARRCGPEHGADPGITVRVKLSIEGSSGEVLSATPQGEHASGSLGRCVAQALGQTRFPRFSSTQMGTIYSVRL